MNKQTLATMLSIIRTMSCVVLCATGCVQAQSHISSRQDAGLGRVITLPTSAWKAKQSQRGRLDRAAATALDAGDYAEAEAEARQSVSLGVASGLGQELLASALNAQGKTQEALQAYKVIADEGGTFPRNLVPYALLLLKSGQWAQAVTAYNKALPYLPEGDMARTNSHFSPDVPQPGELVVALHIAQGLTYGTATWGGHMRHEEAMGEFAQALHLAPDSTLANYYYGYGWQHLDLKSPTRAANAQRAKAALQKAAARVGADVKKAAEEELMRFK